MNDSVKAVKLEVAVGTTGSESIEALGRELTGLAQDGKALPAAFTEAAAALEQLTAATKENRTAEAAAKAEVAAARTALAEKREALAQLKLQTDAAARSDGEYATAERAAKQAILDASIALRQKSEALSTASASARSAASAEQALRADLTAAVTTYRAVGTAATTSGEAQAVATKKAATAVEQLQAQLQALRNLAGLALGGSLIGSLAKDLGETADGFANLSARVKLATGDGAAFDAAFKGVFDIAQRTGTAVEEVGGLFTKLAQAGKELHLSNAEVLHLTELITQATVLSGASAEASAASITQFAQAIASGVLRGDELNSILEQAPRLARALAEGLGVTTGELRKLGEAGALSATQVIGALQGQSAALQREFQSLPPTIGRAITGLSNAWTAYIGEADKATGASATAAAAITALAQNLDTVGTVLYSAGKAALAYQAVKLAATFLDIGTAARASTAAVAAQTAAVVANTAATTANAAAQGASSVASAEAAAGAGRFAAALSTLKLVSFVTIATNFREIGTAIGEGTAKLFGYGKAIEELEARTKADEIASRANAAAKAQLAQETARAADKALGLSDVSRKLVADFDGLRAKGESAGDALKKLTKDLELGDLQGIADAGAALDALAVRGKLAGQQIREALGEALKGVDLGVFETQARAAFDTSEQGARRLKVAIDAVADESLRRAGTSVDELRTGFSKAASSAINDTDAIVRSLDALGISGDDAGRALAKSLDKATEAATTERALKEVIGRIEELGAKGKLSGEQFAAGLEKARQKLDELKPGISSLDEALRNFGLKTQTELQAVADKLKSSYAEIANSVAVSLADKTKAFQQYRDAAVAANGGVESSEIKVQAEMLKMKGAAIDAGRGIASAMAEGGAAVDALGVKVNSLGERLNQTAGSLGGITKAASEISILTSGMAKDASGKVISADIQADIPEGGGFDKAAFDREALLSAQSGNPWYVDPNRFVKGSGATLNGSMTRANAPAASAAPSDNSYGGTRSDGGTRTVVINIPGQAQSILNVSSDMDAQALAKLIEKLTADAARTFKPAM